MGWAPSLYDSFLGVSNFGHDGDDDDLVKWLTNVDDPSIILAFVTNIKEKGNDFFKKKEFGYAIQCYSRAINILNLDFPFIEDEDCEFKKLASALCLNLAASCLKINDFARVISLCSLVLQRENGNVKALYRRAVALIRLDRFDEAHKDLIEAIKISPNDKDIQRELATVQSHLHISPTCTTQSHSQVNDRKGKQIVQAWELGESSKSSEAMQREVVLSPNAIDDHWQGAKGDSQVPMELNPRESCSGSVSSNSTISVLDHALSPNRCSPVNKDVADFMFRFVNRRKRGNSLLISAAQYKTLIDGSEACFYHQVHQSLIKVRVLRKSSKASEVRECTGDSIYEKRNYGVRNLETTVTPIHPEQEPPTNGHCEVPNPKNKEPTSLDTPIDSSTNDSDSVSHKVIPYTLLSPGKVGHLSPQLNERRRKLLKVSTSRMKRLQKPKIRNRSHGNTKKVLDKCWLSSNGTYVCRYYSSPKRKQIPTSTDESHIPVSKKRALSSNCMYLGTMSSVIVVEGTNPCNQCKV